MNSDKLISIEDADLENVAGGIGIAVDLGRLGGANLSLDLCNGVKADASLSLFGKVKAGVNVFLGFGR